MKKTFPLEDPRHKPERVIESIVSEIRKYLKRERRKKLPEGVDFWDFDCRIGPDNDGAGSVHVSAITDAVHQAPKNDWSTLYVEILSKPGHRTIKVTLPPTDKDPAEESGDD